MQPSPPQWPDRSPQSQTPGGKPPQSGSARILGIVAIVSAVLIVALIGTLIVVLQRGAQGSTSIGELQPGSAATVSAAATASTAAQSTQAVASGTTTPQDSGSSTPVPTTSGNHSSPTATPVPPKPSVHRVSNTTTLSGSQTGPAPASCPSGEIALSGGWGLVGDASAAPLSSFRTSTRGWDIYATHSATITVTTYVNCLKNASGASITERKETGIVPPGGTATIIAKCNAGEVVVGGGFGGPAGLEIYNNSANSGTDWLGYVANHNGGSISSTYDVLAECLTYPNASTSLTIGKQISVSNGTSNQVTSNTCPTGQFVSGGGYVYGQKASVYFIQASNSNTTVTAGLYANGGQNETLTVWADCLRL